MAISHHKKEKPLQVLLPSVNSGNWIASAERRMISDAAYFLPPPPFLRMLFASVFLDVSIIIIIIFFSG